MEANPEIPMLHLAKRRRSLKVGEPLQMGAMIINFSRMLSLMFLG
jgi:hypothetical protein